MGWGPVHIAPVALGLAAVSGACVPADPSRAMEGDGAPPDYLGVEAVELDTDLVNMLARMSEPGAPEALEAYARCGAAEHALGKGFAFLRHVRTTYTAERGGVWLADAVYTMSPSRPAGVSRIEAEAALADCAGQGIPTV